MGEAVEARGGARALVELLRPKDWVKNGLVAAPILFAGRALEPDALAHVALAGVALCLAASAGYVLNDLRDLEADRVHPSKRLRPLPSGRVAPGTAGAAAVALAIASLVVGGPNGAGFVGIVATYLVLTAAYTVWWKHVVIVDALLIGAFFILRVLAGAVAADVEASDWLLIATGVVAVFLALCKRRHELLLMGDGAGRHRPALDGYTARFLDSAISLTTSTALITWILYAMAPETVEEHGSRAMLVATPFVLYGLLRYLHLVYAAGRGGRPTELVLTDRGILAAVAGFGFVCALVVYGGC